MGDVNIAAAAAAATATAATPYMFSFFLFDMLIEFQFVEVALDLICLSTVLVDGMISLILVTLVINCLLFSWIKSTTKLHIYSVNSLLNI